MENRLDITFDTRWQELHNEYLNDPLALASKLFSNVLTDHQATLLNNESSRLVITSCSGTGTTTAIAFKAVLTTVFNPEMPVNVYLLPERKTYLRFKYLCRSFFNQFDLVVSMDETIF